MSSRPAGDFVVYACEACGKRIFTDRSHTGRRGTCPLCGAEHVVGGAPTLRAREGVERRAGTRVPAEHARVTVGALEVERLLPVRDVSENGIAFRLPTGQPAAAGDLEVGQRMQLTLHTRELLRPRTYAAEVRRLEDASGETTVGLQFVDLTPEQEAEVRALVRRIGQDA